jgi:acetoin utilization protein AcuB
MYIVASMSPHPLCLRPGMSLLNVRELTGGKSVRHFPVIDDAGRPLGMVSDRDLRSAFPSTVLNPMVRQDQLARLADVRVETIMSRPPLTLSLEATLDDALLLFDRHRVGALLVVDHDGLLAGIVTVRDVLAAYRRLFGIGVPGASQVEVCDDGLPNLMSRIVDALEGGGTVCTRLIRAEAADGSGASVYARVHTINLHRVHESLRAAGLEVVSRKAGAAAR